MLFSALLLGLGLFLILLAAEGFTNGVEALGKRFSFSQAVVGSILAAVGTALPETILPIVAIFIGGGEAAKEIGVGAILGAPFMLGTIAFFVVGIAAIVRSAKKHQDKLTIKVEPRTLRRDLAFFIPMYAAAIVIPLVTGRAFVVPLAILLVLGYFYYVYRTVRGESADLEHTCGLHFCNIPNRMGLTKLDAPHMMLIVAQIVIALVVMVSGAHIFVKSLEHVSLALGMSPLLFALILAPIATELPEKFNSVTWTLKGKDSLAVGNITGAMVFQSTFPVSVGLLFTEWQVTGMALLSAIFALLSAAIMLAVVTIKKKIPASVMLLGGLFYLIYVVLLVFTIKG